MTIQKLAVQPKFCICSRAIIKTLNLTGIFPILGHSSLVFLLNHPPPRYISLNTPPDSEKCIYVFDPGLRARNGGKNQKLTIDRFHQAKVEF